MCSNTDLQARNVTLEWIVLLRSRDHEYLIYKAFKQKFEVFDSSSGFGIKYLVLYVSKEIVSE